jgi:hypothetical protein
MVSATSGTIAHSVTHDTASAVSCRLRSPFHQGVIKPAKVQIVPARRAYFTPLFTSAV